MKHRPIWIALVNVRKVDPSADIMSGREYAYVNVVGPGHSVSDFSVALNAAADALGLMVLEIEKPELFEERTRRVLVRPELHELADEAEENGEFQFDTFHTYPKDTDLQ